MARIRQLLLATLAATASVFVLSSTITTGNAQAAKGCGSTPYSYAGIQTASGTHGIAATLTAVRTPAVAGGHVAGWVGVGGPGEGANGADAWIQIGLNALPGSGNKIYAEAWIPGYGQAYKELGEVPAGQKVRIAVLEVKGRPGVWRGWVDGKPVTKPVALPGSQGGAWSADAIAESWNGGSQACNDYSYNFENVAQAASPGGSWKPVRDATTLQDPGQRLLRRTASSFLATAGS